MTRNDDDDENDENDDDDDDDIITHPCTYIHPRCTGTSTPTKQKKIKYGWLTFIIKAKTKPN